MRKMFNERLNNVTLINTNTPEENATATTINGIANAVKVAGSPEQQKQILDDLVVVVNQSTPNVLQAVKPEDKVILGRTAANLKTEGMEMTTVLEATDAIALA
jgi:hypothetical protein